MKKKYTKKQVEQIVENELRKGSTYKEISEIIGRGHRIYQIKSLLIEKGLITDEEIEQAKIKRTKTFLMTDPTMQKIMKYVKSGLSQTDIGHLVGLSQYVVGYNIRKFIQYGLITREEVDNARQEYSKEVRYDNFRRDEVLEQLQQGRLKNHFAPELGLTGGGARVIQDSLIEEGRITKAEIEEAIATKGIEAQRRKRAIELLKQGYMYKEVTEAVGYCPQTVKKIKEQAISEGMFTEEEYQRARKERIAKLKSEPQKPKEDKQLEEQVLELLTKGKDMYFMRKKTGETRTNIQSVIKKLIRDGKITQSEIDEAKERAIKELENKVLIGLRRWYPQREIVAMFEEGEHSLKYIQSCISRLIERGDITAEEIEQYKYEAEQGKKELYEFVLRGIKQGLSRAAMANLDENGYFTESMIRTAIENMKQQGIITEKDIQKGRKARKKANQKSAQKARNKKDKEIVKLLLEGLSAKEIGDRLGYLENTIWENTVRIKKEGKITEEQIKNARKQRREAEKQEKKKAQEKQQKEDEELAKFQEKEEQKQMEAYRNNLKLASKILKADDKYTEAQINHLVKKLIQLATMMQSKGLLKSEELKIISKVLFQSESIDVNNVLGIAKLYLKMKDYHSSIYTLNYSKDFFTQEEDLQKINQAVKTIGIYRRKMEAAQMLDQNYDVEVIAQRTKLSVAEVINLKNRKIQKQQKGSNNKIWTDAQGDDEFPGL